MSTKCTDLGHYYGKQHESGKGVQHLYQCITTWCLLADESDSGGRPGLEGAAAAAANEDCPQGRAGGMQSQQSAFHQQPAEAHTLGMWCPSLQHDRSSKYLLAGLQSAGMPGQRSRQQPSPTARHNTQRSAGSRQYQQTADAMRRDHALQAQTRHAPHTGQQPMAPVGHNPGSVQYMRGSLHIKQRQQSAPVVPTRANRAARGGIWSQSAAMVPAAALATTSARIEANDLYSQLSMQPDATLFHRQAFAASLSDIFQRKSGRRRH